MQTLTQPCGLRLYVYEQYEPLLEAILHVGGQMFTLHEPGGVPLSRRRRLVSNATCFEHDCQYRDFANATPRVFTGDVPIYQRLVQRCRRVTDPSQADVFVLPVPLSSLQVLSWNMGAYLPAMCVAPELMGWSATAIRAAEVLPRSMNRTVETLRKHSLKCREKLKAKAKLLVQQAMRLFRRHGLPMLSARTAPRHLFLFSNDVQFVPLQVMAREWLNATALTPLLMRSLVVHLGDDSSTVGPRSITQKQPGRYLYNDLTVPYRVSQWMALGWPPPVRPKRFLLSGNLNGKKSKYRGQLLHALGISGKKLGLVAALYLSSSNQPPAIAAQVAAESTFCLAPTGDSKGFTARLFYALLHGCIPVRVDAFEKRSRSLNFSQVNFPFRSLLDWSRLILDEGANSLVRNASGFLGRLRGMPPHEVADRQAYIRNVSHYLSYDLEHPQFPGQDAPGALIRELEQRVARLDDPAFVAALEQRQKKGDRGLLCQSSGNCQPAPSM